MNFEQPKPIQEQERPEVEINQINPESLTDIANYYQFELDYGFSTMHPETTLEKMVNFRQQQIKDSKLKVAMAKEGDRLVATSVVILENETMGKKIKSDEAWAAGTLVVPEARGLGIGEKMSQIQDQIAKEAGKESIVTTITNNNFPSMRLRMKVGYRLEGIDQREDETNYLYRKNLNQESFDNNDFKEQVENGNLKIFEGSIDNSSPNEILINPSNSEQVQEALNNNYEGVHLLRPEDFTEQELIDKELIVFRRKVNEKTT